MKFLVYLTGLFLVISAIFGYMFYSLEKSHSIWFYENVFTEYYEEFRVAEDNFLENQTSFENISMAYIELGSVSSKPGSSLNEAIAEYRYAFADYMGALNLDKDNTGEYFETLMDKKKVFDNEVETYIERFN